MPSRDPLPTLTEDDLRSQGERVTMPTPMSAEQIRQMMAAAEEEPPPPPPAAGVDESLEIAEIPASEQADVVDDLVQGYLAGLGSRSHVPFVVAARPAELQIDHWAGFILSLVDGATSISEIIDATPMPEHDTLRLLTELQQRRAIEVRPPKPPARPARPAAPLSTSAAPRPAPAPVPTSAAPKPPAEPAEPLTLDDLDSWT